MNDGNTAANDTPDIVNTGGLTLTDFKTATIDASVESTALAAPDATDFNAIDGSADNTNLTIKAGSNAITLSGAHTVGTGVSTIESDGSWIRNIRSTANVFTHTGSGAVTWTDANSSEVKTISTGSGNDTTADLTSNMTIGTGAGDDTIKFMNTTTSGSKSYHSMVVLELISYQFHLIMLD